MRCTDQLLGLLLLVLARVDCDCPRQLPRFLQPCPSSAEEAVCTMPCDFGGVVSATCRNNVWSGISDWCSSVCDVCECTRNSEHLRCELVDRCLTSLPVGMLPGLEVVRYDGIFARECLVYKAPVVQPLLEGLTMLPPARWTVLFATKCCAYLLAQCWPFCHFYFFWSCAMLPV